MLQSSSRALQAKEACRHMLSLRPRSAADIWQDSTDNWSKLCVAMGCEKISLPGAVVQTYQINRSGSFYNSVFVQNPQSFEVKQVEGVFAERNLPFSIILPSLKPYRELSNSLSEQRYLLAPPWSLMVHEASIDRSSPDVRVEEIHSSKLADWFELQDAFPHVESSRQARLEMIERVSREDSTHLFLASLEGRSVGAGLLFIKDQVASIHMIATLPEFRRRQVATTVTLEAIGRARRDKADLLWLRTRKGGTGEKVYTKIGFTSFSDILSYSRTPQCEDSNLPPR